MFKTEFENVVEAAKAKLNFLEKNPFGYFLASCLAGVYIALGCILFFSVGNYLSGEPYAKLAMGGSFSVALSLVIFAGSELFTGNNLIMAAGSFQKKVSWGKTIHLWIVCYLGNWIGCIITSVLYYLSGLRSDSLNELISTVAVAKTTAPVGELFIRGIFCNILVCLAVWSVYRMKSESGKLIMIFWCIFAFTVSGFEHCIANMTMLTLGLLEPAGQGIALSGYFINIFVVTLGNITGAVIFLVLPYFIIQKEKNKSNSEIKLTSNEVCNYTKMN